MSNARNLADLSAINKKQLAKAWVKFDGKTGAVATVKSSFLTDFIKLLFKD